MNRFFPKDSHLGRTSTEPSPKLAAKLSALLTPSALEAWLEKQPPETPYEFNRPSDCLLTRYLRASGVPELAKVACGSSYVQTGTDARTSDWFFPLPLELVLPVAGAECYARALERLRHGESTPTLPPAELSNG